MAPHAVTIKPHICINSRISSSLQVKSSVLRARHGGQKGSAVATTVVNTGQLVLPALEAFALSAVARAVSALTCYPATRGKVLAQARLRNMKNERAKVMLKLGTPPSSPDRRPDSGGGDDQGHELTSTSATEELLIVLREQGVLGLYQGLGPEIARGVLSSAIRMAVKERIFVSVRGVLARVAGRRAA
jgi:hypothetical protein